MGQSQTLSVTSGFLNFENSNHVIRGISLRQDVTSFLSLGIERIGGQYGEGTLKMTSTSLRYSPWNLKAPSVQPWLSGGVCYRSLTPELAVTPDLTDNNSKLDVGLSQQIGMTIPITAGIDFHLSDRFNSSIAVTTHMGKSGRLEEPQRTYHAKTARTDAVITVLQVGLAFNIIKAARKKHANTIHLNELKRKDSIEPLNPVLYVNTRGGVVTEHEWNNIFPSLGDPSTYAIDHEIIVSQYSIADYKKMKEASENKIMMYEKEAVERINASILNHMSHDNKIDNDNKRDSQKQKK